MSEIATFWCEEADRVKRQLRRYSTADRCAHPSNHGLHDARRYVDEIEHAPRTYLHCTDGSSEGFARTDARWPTHCACGRAFTDRDEWQLREVRLMRRTDTGEIMTDAELPVGATWDAWWDWDRGSDGLSLVVRTPGGDWSVDHRASNCTLPDDDRHACWCRHGDPRLARVTVDKIGHTCSAGGGSIMVGTYHGFLVDGRLTNC